jgi:hypothetical protein
LWAKGLTTGQENPLTTSLTAETRFARLSYDGSQAVYLDTEGGHRTLRIIGVRNQPVHGPVEFPCDDCSSSFLNWFSDNKLVFTLKERTGNIWMTEQGALR